MIGLLRSHRVKFSTPATNKQADEHVCGVETRSQMARLTDVSVTGHTILIVDDDPMLLVATSRLLEREGHRVFVAENGSAGVALCRQERVQLVLLDYYMPGMTGEDVVKEIRSFDKDVRIILQTGQANRPARQLLRDLEIQGYHDKSEGPEKLLIWVDAALKTSEEIRKRRDLEDSLQALGIALEYRDFESKGHTESVVKLSGQLGKVLGLDETQLEHLCHGAYLHDLGKLAIPDGILLKPGKLSLEEFERMKEHTSKGFEMARRIKGLAPEVLHIIRHHHERWDGTGYPDRLAGEAIPLLARVFSVCDVFDALLSRRVYKNPWTREEALEEIRNQRGKQFDPEVTTAFLDMIQGQPVGTVTAPAYEVERGVS
jgi:putative nucleotidyltransferase with HDIG domain